MSAGSVIEFIFSDYARFFDPLLAAAISFPFIILSKDFLRLNGRVDQQIWDGFSYPLPVIC